MTQAIALRRRLEKAGHEVCLTMVGVSRFRTLPDFFAERMGGPVTTFQSPVLVTDRHQKGVSFARTAVHSFLSLPRYTLSVFQIRRAINRHRPDVVINFFDLMCSFSFLLRLRRPRHVCVGHQFYFQHPDFQRPETKSPRGSGPSPAYAMFGLPRRPSSRSFVSTGRTHQEGTQGGGSPTQK